ncbi:MAG: enoyl-ACP reductase [Betaproteobacteria bacterium TMED156]|nr:MAG: enoyl-ACP reductase [Betaproteobacteria bacterium TMED156]
MSFLKNKKILISGMISNRSIAYGIAKACHNQGARIAFSYQGERFKDRINNLAREFESKMCFDCDVAKDDNINGLHDYIATEWDGLDGFVHAIAFAPREAISGDFLDGFNRENFLTAHDISVYSFGAMVKSLLPLMRNRDASVATLSYLGAERSVTGYNTMGLAKASLEASVRYLAASCGPLNVRVNGVSAGPIKTLAASGIKGFSDILKKVETHSPMRKNITIDDVGNVVAFLLSDLSKGITGEITHVDNGYNSVVT